MGKGVPSNQMKALAMAMAGATIAAVAMMFVPGALLEGLTGATGLSELVPAAAAPLGHTARAMMAFSAGAITLAVLAFLLLRQDGPPRQVAAEIPSTVDDETDDVGEASSFKDRLARIALPKMPWAKGEDDITDLSDLPKLRNGDVHPDAPPRRPLYAQQDLPVVELEDAPVAAPLTERSAPAEAEEIATVAQAPHETIEAPQSVAEQAASATPTMPTDIQPTLAEMVAQLEAAVAERQRQLVELEAVAAQLGAGQIVEHVSAEAVEIIEPIRDPVRQDRPPLEAVPASAKDDDIDSALAAALATLHRMNGTDR